MLRLIATTVVAVISSAVALIVSSLLIPDMSLEVDGLIVAILIFTGVTILAEPLIRQNALRRAPALLGSVALVSTLVSLIVTALLSSGLRIEGLVTWVLATVAVWALALIARMLLPLVIFTKVLRGVRDEAGGAVQ